MSNMETLRMSLLLRIPELSKSHVIMADPTGVCDKLRKMSEDGKDTIQTVFDFDQTLTKTVVDNKRVVSSFEVLLYVPDIPKEFIAEGAKVMKTHSKVAGDVKLSTKEKLPIIDECYKQINGLLKKAQMPFSDSSPIEQVVKKSNIVLRDGVEKAFKTLKDCSVPITIISAGLTYSIDTILKDKGILYSNVNVIANSFSFENNKLNGFSGDVVHVLNKNEFFLKDEICSKDTKQRHNIILVGDYTTDATMVDGVGDSTNVLKIAFYNYDQNDESLIEEFKKVFDVIICNDESTDVLHGIFRYVTNSSF